jgi:hypothetical protein
MTAIRVVLAVSLGLFLAWGGIWVLLLPALMIGDADNGRFQYDLYRMWIPELGSAAAAVVYCIIMLAAGGARPRPWTMIPPAVLAAVVTTFTVVGLPLIATTGPGR